MVYQLDKEFVLTKLFPDIVKEKNFSSNIQVDILDELKISKALSVESLSQFFPWCELILFDKNGETVEGMIWKEKREYGVILFGIFAVLLIGVVMTLRAATHEAEMARLKSNFVSNVSHELKTPLALIRLFGETLELGQVKDLNQQ